MNASQLENLKNNLNTTTNDKQFKGIYRAIMSLEKPVEIQNDQLDLARLNPRQQWLLHFVYRKNNAFKLSDIITKDEHKTMMSAKRAHTMCSIQQVERSVDQLPLCPDVVERAEDEAIETVHENLSVEIAITAASTAASHCEEASSSALCDNGEESDTGYDNVSESDLFGDENSDFENGEEGDDDCE